MHFFRHHKSHDHLQSAFGADWFGQKAEQFARFFGTPKFIIWQTVIVTVWILVNVLGWFVFDAYPFVFLNLAFSTQAAYAAPLILLAQTRQADRDKANAIADAQHREEIHQIEMQRSEQMKALLEQNTQLTEQINRLTAEIHGKLNV
jgi:uncharacterized membrane protein